VSGRVVKLVRKVPLGWMVLSVPVALLVILALRDRPARKARQAETALLDRRARQETWDQVDRLALLDPRVRVVRSGHAANSAPRAIRDQPVPLAPLGWPAHPATPPRRPR